MRSRWYRGGTWREDGRKGKEALRLDPVPDLAIVEESPAAVLGFLDSLHHVTASTAISSQQIDVEA